MSVYLLFYEINNIFVIDKNITNFNNRINTLCVDGILAY